MTSVLAPAPVGERAPARTRAASVVVPVVVALVALGFVMRLLALVKGGGLLGIGDYDDGVYFSAADALIHGRLPYASFVFVQPPGILLVAAPFALIGALFGDPAGLIAGRLAFEVLGGASAALVFLILRRFGWTGALVGGVLYAVFDPAVYAERSVLLEPVGAFCVLLSLYLARRSASPASALVAGIAAGFAVDVKVWYLVPAVILALGATPRRGRFALGALAAMVVGYGPFLVAAPVATVRQIVLDQLGRPRMGGLTRRLAGIAGGAHIGPVHLQTVTAVFLLLVLVAFLVAVATRGARIFAVLLAAEGLVLLAAPSWFPHYGDFTAGALVLCVGVAAQRAIDAMPPLPWARTVVAVLAVGVLLVGWAVGDARTHRTQVAVPTSVTTAMRRVDGCVTSDDPTVLAVGDVLSRDLARPGCVVWPDVTGRTYDVDRPSSNRPRNARWQRDVLTYLRSGRATVVVRSGTGLSAATRAELHRLPALAGSGRFVLRATDHR